MTPIKPLYLPIIQKIILTLLLALLSANSQAAPSTALGYKPKYPLGFKHFAYTNPNAPKGGRLVLHGDGNFDSLNPYLLKGVPVEGLGLVFETLMIPSLDEPYSLYGHLAEDIKLAPNKLSVTFRLDPMARFSDGTPVTAYDVKFSFDTIKNKGHPRFRFFWADIKRVKVINSRMVKFFFTRSYPELHLLAAQIPVFSRKWVGKEPFEKLSRTLPIASGPYVIEKYRLGKDITYKRNPRYWARYKNTRRGMYNFNRIRYKYYKDSTIRLEALKAAEYDFLHENYSKLWAREHVGAKYDSGNLKKVEFSHQSNAGMQGFVFNTRRGLFRDRRVRKAIALAYDFSWANRNLFYRQYKRCDSYFSNSKLAARGLPKGQELRLLNRFRKQLPSEIFTTTWRPSNTDKPGNLRNNLHKAKTLLEQAGWYVENNVLRNKKGQRFEFEVLLLSKGFERILGTYAHNLRKLGIILHYRTVDISLYIRRLRTFDFDMVVATYGGAEMPGIEIFGYWHSSVVKTEGSRNYAGIKDPVVDALIKKVVYAPDYRHRVAAAKALDRVLLFGEYLVPNWYISTYRVAYWDKFLYPKTLPLYYDPTSWAISTWWSKKEYRQKKKTNQ